MHLKFAHIQTSKNQDLNDDPFFSVNGYKTERFRYFQE